MLHSVLALSSVLSSAPAAAADATVVRSDAAASSPADVRVTTASALSPEDALLDVAGLALTHDGGPLAPVRPLVHGLGGARLHVDAMGLAVVDPASGLLDASALPWALGAVVVDASADDAVAGAIALPVPRAGTLLRVAGGDLSTLRGQLSTSIAVTGGRAFVALDGGFSDGAFRYVTTSPLGARGPLARRDNADQRRASAALGVVTSGAVDDVAWSVLMRAVGSAHEGGIAGFSTAPTTTLRADDALWSAGVRSSFDAAAARAVVDIQRTVSARAVQDAGARDALTSTSHTLDVRAASAWPGLQGVHIDVGARAARIDVARAAGVFPAPLAVRNASGGFIGLSGQVGESSSPTSSLLSSLLWRARIEADALSDVQDPPVSVVVGTSWDDDVRGVRGDLQCARHARAPTLDEMFAPAGLVVGNPALRPESSTECRAAASMASPRFALRARAAVWGAFVDDAIVYVNRNAFVIAPDNTGRAWRTGSDVEIEAAPMPALHLAVVPTLLLSRVEATDAPLPTAPAWRLRTRAIVGAPAGAHIAATVDARAGAPSTIFGTLPSAPWTMLGLRARLPLDEHVAAGVQIDNALDVLDARDANLLPLPGRLIFVTLEVRA